MDNQELIKLIGCIGSMAEMAAMIRDALIRNGFTRSEAVSISSNFITSMMFNSNGGNKNG